MFSGRLYLEPGSDTLDRGPAPRIGADRPRHYLGAWRGRPVWAVDMGGTSGEEFGETADGTEWEAVPLRAAYGRLDDASWGLAGRAEQIVAWDRTHAYCGRCGTPTTHHDHDRARQCPECGLLSYPRISPAVIVLVTRGDEILLAHGRQFPGRFFSTLAGFVEPGESLEECIHREIHEEVGIRVTDIEYFGSQPWPFPNSLMIGFTAAWESGELVPQEEEIVEAGWFRADSLPPCPIGGMSIAGWMIEHWLADRRD